MRRQSITCAATTTLALFTLGFSMAAPARADYTYDFDFTTLGITVADVTYTSTSLLTGSATLTGYTVNSCLYCAATNATSLTISNFDKTNTTGSVSFSGTYTTSLGPITIGPVTVFSESVGFSSATNGTINGAGNYTGSGGSVQVTGGRTTMPEPTTYLELFGDTAGLALLGIPALYIRSRRLKQRRA
jgi:hypothetical protein